MQTFYMTRGAVRGRGLSISMDCRTFRKHHLAYLDDTLPGDVMARAQCHVLNCDACAAHDTMVRRSLMMVRSLPTDRTVG